MTTKFKHRIGKDICGNVMHKYIHHNKDSENVRTQITVFKESHAEDQGGVLIDVKRVEPTVVSEISLYLNVDEVRQLVKILTTHLPKQEYW